MANTGVVPVFVINGFLESGKTSFITDAILRDPNMLQERVLIIVCEEGIEEYESLPDNMSVYEVEEPEDLTTELFATLRKKYSPTFVVIEYNGVWGMQTLYNNRIPDNWGLAQQITVVDSTSFKSYFANMKSIFADMLRNSGRVFFNRCTRDDDFRFYRDSAKSCSPLIDVVYMNDEEGIMDILLEEDLPYDLSADVISVNKDNFMLWYIDAMENQSRYSGKTFEFEGVVLRPENCRQGYFIVGNEVMTCCEDDMQFFGFLCEYERSDFVKEGNTVKVQGKIRYEFAPEYEFEGPVLYLNKVTTIANVKKKKKK